MARHKKKKKPSRSVRRGYLVDHPEIAGGSTAKSSHNYSYYGPASAEEPVDGTHKNKIPHKFSYYGPASEEPMDISQTSSSSSSGWPLNPSNASEVRFPSPPTIMERYSAFSPKVTPESQTQENRLLRELDLEILQREEEDLMERLDKRILINEEEDLMVRVEKSLVEDGEITEDASLQTKTQSSSTMNPEAPQDPKVLLGGSTMVESKASKKTSTPPTAIMDIDSSGDANQAQPEMSSPNQSSSEQAKVGTANHQPRQSTTPASSLTPLQPREVQESAVSIAKESTGSTTVTSTAMHIDPSLDASPSQTEVLLPNQLSNEQTGAVVTTNQPPQSNTPSSSSRTLAVVPQEAQVRSGSTTGVAKMSKEPSTRSTRTDSDATITNAESAEETPSILPSFEYRKQAPTNSPPKIVVYEKTWTLWRILRKYTNQIIFDKASFERDFVKPVASTVCAEQDPSIFRVVVKSNTTNLQVTVTSSSKTLPSYVINKAKKWQQYQTNVKILDLMLHDDESHVLEFQIDTSKQMLGLVLGLSLVRLHVFGEEVPLPTQEGVWCEIKEVDSPAETEILRLVDSKVFRHGAAVLAVENSRCHTRESVIELVKKQKSLGKDTYRIVFCLPRHADCSGVKVRDFKQSKLGDFKKAWVEGSTQTAIRDVSPIPPTEELHESQGFTVKNDDDEGLQEPQGFTVNNDDEEEEAPTMDAIQVPNAPVTSRSNDTDDRCILERTEALVEENQHEVADQEMNSKVPSQKATETSTHKEQEESRSQDQGAISPHSAMLEHKHRLYLILKDPKSIEIEVKLNAEESVGAKLRALKSYKMDGGLLHAIREDSQLRRVLGKSICDGSVCIHKVNGRIIHDHIDFKYAKKLGQQTKSFHATLLLEEGTDISEIDTTRLLQAPKLRNGEQYKPQSTRDIASTEQRKGKKT